MGSKAYNDFDFPVSAFRLTESDGPYQRYKQIEWYPSQRSSALLTEVRNGHLEAVQYLINIGTVNQDQALTMAIQSNDHWHANRLISAGAADRNQALNAAAARGHLPMVQYLVSQGATDIGSALAAAAYNGQKEIVRYLKSLL